MTTFRFIHCSDLHIDSPFKGLSAVEPRLARRLLESTYKAFNNIVDLAVQEKVDALIVAGDVYDSADRSLQAQFRFRNALAHLSQAGIPAFIAHGNHDPLDRWSNHLDWPSLATVFPGDRVEAHPVTKNGKTVAHVYGISFPRRDVTENLALRFKRGGHPGFAVGVLHTNVGGRPGHDPYAPCTVSELSAPGMDYWALGHIHAREVVQAESPAIVYSGNTQARSVREAGPRGCYLVTLTSGAPPETRFTATDAVRYETQTLDASRLQTVDDILHACLETVDALATKAGERDLVVRLTLTGRTPVHQEIVSPGGLAGLQEQIQLYFEVRDPLVWVDLVVDTRGDYDIDALGQGQDFIADVVALFQEAAQGKHPQVIEEALKPLFADWPGRKYLEETTREDRAAWLEAARGLVLDRLVDHR